MRPSSDRLAVANAHLQLRNIQGLRATDSFIMPLVTGGNTNTYIDER